MASGSDVITVLTWNINGLKDKLENHKTALLKIFGRYDVVLLQETHIGNMKNGTADNKNWEIITKALPDKYTLIELKDQTHRKRRKWEEETMYLTYFSSRSKGVAIIVKKSHTLLSSFSAGGDYAGVHVQIGGQEYMFVSVYYHRDANKQIRNLIKEISTKGLDASKCRLVIGGDFNTTLDPELDATKPIPDHAGRRKIVNELLDKVKLTDVWRVENTGKPQYTRTPPHSRLDYVFILEDEKCKRRCKIRDDIDLSDHSPVSLTLTYTNDRRE